MPRGGLDADLAELLPQISDVHVDVATQRVLLDFAKPEVPWHFGLRRCRRRAITASRRSSFRAQKACRAARNWEYRSDTSSSLTSGSLTNRPTCQKYKLRSNRSDRRATQRTRFFSRGVE